MPGFASRGNAAICCGSVWVDVDDFAGAADCAVALAGVTLVASDAAVDVWPAADKELRTRTAANFNVNDETHFIRSWMRSGKTILFRLGCNLELPVFRV